LGAAIPLHPASEPDQPIAASNNAAQTARCTDHGRRYRLSRINSPFRRRRQSGNDYAEIRSEAIKRLLSKSLMPKE
jgi:hypothetical protein